VGAATSRRRVDDPWMLDALVDAIEAEMAVVGRPLVTEA
jgi:hypothetical protein